MLVIAYIPCSSEEEAQRISKSLIAEKLVACVNIIKSRSIYLWEGQPRSENEWIILGKSLPKMFPAIKKRVMELHSYELPCIIGIPVADVNEPYLEWVEDQVK